MKKTILLTTVLLMGCFTMESIAVEENYKRTCKKCTKETSKLMIGYTLRCKCKDWDGKYVDAVLPVTEECWGDGAPKAINNCNGYLICTKKCPKKKFLGIF